jgi:hypothetical protein
MNSLLVILALKCLVEYFIDSRTRSCAATIADTHRDGNPAGNTADVAPLTKSNVYLALVDVSFPTEFANRRFFFSWHSRVQSPPVSPMEVTLHHLALILCELPHTHPLSSSRHLPSPRRRSCSRTQARVVRRSPPRRVSQWVTRLCDADRACGDLGLQGHSDKMLSEAMDCRHKKAPTEPGLQVIITSRGVRPATGSDNFTMRAFGTPVTRFFGGSTNRSGRRDISPSSHGSSAG